MKIEANTKSCVPLFAAFFVLPMLFALNSFTDTGKYRIKQMVNLRTNHSSEYFYNAKGLITEVKDLMGNSTRYEYLNGKIIKTMLIGGNVKCDTIFLAKTGLVDEIHESNGGMQKLTFTKDSLFTEARAYYKPGDLAFISSEQYLKGNERTSLLTDEHGKKLNVLYYEYYPNTNNTIGYENMGMIFMGKGSINLVSKSAGIIETDTGISIYKYHFDDKGRVRIKAAYGKNGKLIDSTGYSYY